MSRFRFILLLFISLSVFSCEQIPIEKYFSNLGCKIEDFLSDNTKTEQDIITPSNSATSFIKTTTVEPSTFQVIKHPVTQKPFFPRELYYLFNDSDYQTAQLFGFNSVIERGDHTLALAEKYDFPLTVANWYTKSTSKRTIQKGIQEYNQSPQILAYNLNDEPDLRMNTIDWGTLTHQIEWIKGVHASPHISVTLAGSDASRKFWHSFAEHTSLIRVDPYPIIENKPLSLVGDLIQEAQQASQFNQPIITILQAWHFGAGSRFPNASEIRTMVFLSLINGTSGLSYFCWDLQAWLQFPAFINEVFYTNYLVRSLEPMYLNGDHFVIKDEDNEILARYIQWDNEWIILAANTSRNDLIISPNIEKLKNASPIPYYDSPNSTPQTSRKGYPEFYLAPLQVQIWASSHEILEKLPHWFDNKRVFASFYNPDQHTINIQEPLHITENTNQTESNSVEHKDILINTKMQNRSVLFKNISNDYIKAEWEYTNFYPWIKTPVLYELDSTGSPIKQIPWIIKNNTLYFDISPQSIYLFMDTEQITPANPELFSYHKSDIAIQINSPTLQKQSLLNSVPIINVYPNEDIPIEFQIQAEQIIIHSIECVRIENKSEIIDQEKAKQWVQPKEIIQKNIRYPNKPDTYAIELQAYWTFHNIDFPYTDRDPRLIFRLDVEIEGQHYPLEKGVYIHQITPYTTDVTFEQLADQEQYILFECRGTKLGYFFHPYDYFRHGEIVLKPTNPELHALINSKKATEFSQDTLELEISKLPKKWTITMEPMHQEDDTIRIPFLLKGPKYAGITIDPMDIIQPHISILHNSKPLQSFDFPILKLYNEKIIKPGETKQKFFLPEPQSKEDEEERLVESCPYDEADTLQYKEFPFQIKGTFHQSGGKQFATEQSEFTFCVDENALHIQMFYHHPNPNALRAETQEPDTHMLADDLISLVLVHPEKPAACYRMDINPAGVVRDGIWWNPKIQDATDITSKPDNLRDLSWNSNITPEIIKNINGWGIKCSIPLDIINFKPKEHITFFFNVLTRRSIAPFMYTSWMPIENLWDLEQYAQITFPQ